MQALRPGMVQALKEVNPFHWPIGAWAILCDICAEVTRLPSTAQSFSKPSVSTNDTLTSVMHWLARAQDSTSSGGVAAYYGLYGGFGPSYPETTGYIIPTMLRYARTCGHAEFTDRAINAGEWLLNFQRDNGAFPGGFAKKKDGPSVFNSGQILLGLIALWNETKEQKFLDAACRNADWLGSIQSHNGSWECHTYEGNPHVYYTMVSWALAELYCVTQSESYRQTANRQLTWAISQQQENGWFDSFNLQGRPIFLHFIAYTLQGLVEAGRIFNDQRYVEASRMPAELLLHRFERRKSLAGAFHSDWTSHGKYACITGNAQIALVWSTLTTLTGDIRFLNASLKINEWIKTTICQRGTSGIRGAVKGSQPVWGPYLCMRYPNWAAKFSADSLMNELSFSSRKERICA